MLTTLVLCFRLSSLGGCLSEVEAQLLELDALRNEFSSREVFEARHSSRRAQQAAELTIAAGKMSRNEGAGKSVGKSMGIGAGEGEGATQLSGKQLQCSENNSFACAHLPRASISQKYMHFAAPI